jgi:exopolysaccharide biosynthesis polyprenyl glycosylphosphotransferase
LTLFGQSDENGGAFDESSRRTGQEAAPPPGPDPRRLPVPASTTTAPSIAPVTRRHLHASEHRALLLLGDAIVSVLAVAVSLWLWTLTGGFTLSSAIRTRPYWFAAAVVWLLALRPAQSLRVALSLRETVRSLARAAAFLLVGYLVLYFYVPPQKLPRLFALYFVWESVLLTLGWRLVYAWVFTQPRLRRRAAIVGAGPAGERMLSVLEANRMRELLVVAFVDAEGEASGPVVRGLPVVSGPDGVGRLVASEGVSTLILTVPEAHGALLKALVACQEAGVEIVPMAMMYEQLLERLPVEHLEPNWLFRSYAEAVRAKDSSPALKRLLDLAGGLAGLAVLAAVGPFVASAIWLDSGRPIFYKQRRVGRAGRCFELTKFRTMVTDAEANGPRWAGPADPRTTRVGRFLRRVRLDELPNLFSVVRGDMSLVGPRPERPEFVADLERHIPFYRARLLVRPGLTGWAQVNHPYGDSIEDAVLKLEYDLYYLKHRSMLFDLVILVRTLGTVLRLGGQ